MADELHDLRLKKNLSMDEIVAAIQAYCPKFDKPMLSKVGHADKYGVTLRRDVVDKLIERFAPDMFPAVKKKRNGDHRLTCRISCRLEDNDFEALWKNVRADGYDTMQDWLTDTVRHYNDFHTNKINQAKEQNQ